MIKTINDIYSIVNELDLDYILSITHPYGYDGFFAAIAFTI